MTFFSAEDVKCVDIEILRNTHEKENALHRRHRRAMKREKKFVRELERKCEKYNEQPANYYRYCKRPFAHHKRDDRVDHRVLQADAYPIRARLRDMYEEREMSDELANVFYEPVYPEDYYETYDYEAYYYDDNYEEDYYDDLFFWNDECERCNDDFLWCAESEGWDADCFYPDESERWDDERFWPDESECCDGEYHWPDECERSDDACMIEKEFAIMESALAERQEMAEYYDMAMMELHEETQFVALATGAAVMAHEQAKLLRRRHRKANIREKGYIAMLDEKVNSKAKEEGRKPENFRRQSKRPHSRRFEERERMHSQVDHRTACANAYPVAVQLRDMYEECA